MVQKKDPMTRKELKLLISDLHRCVQNWDDLVRTRTQITNRIKAIVRRQLNKELEEKVTQKDIEQCLKARNKKTPTLESLYYMVGQLTGEVKSVETGKKEKMLGIGTTIVSCEADIVKAIDKLPIWQKWGKNISGVGQKSFAKIIAHAVTADKFFTVGDYTNPGKLWKRFGVAVVENPKTGEKEAQRKVGNDKELAILHGFSSKRRSELWVIGDVFKKQCISREKYYKSLGKSAAEIKKLCARDETETELRARIKTTYKKSYYAARYMQEKKRQKELHPKVIIDEKGKKRFYPGHLDNRAMRKTTKLFLQDLWNKWRELHGEGEYHKSEDRW
jgi:hypothetical protein